jgi:hypothetical protein
MQRVPSEENVEPPFAKEALVRGILAIVGAKG